MRDLTKSLVEELLQRWPSQSIRETLLFCQSKEMIEISERLSCHLERSPCTENFDKDQNVVDKEN